MVGFVPTLAGRPIESGEIAGGLIHDHDNFQNAQSFLADGGRRGLQEQVLLSGAWNINPWFAAVESVPMLHIPIGSVGVVISFVGLAHEDVSGAAFKHGDLVNVGHKGVWVPPLHPGRHPTTTRHSPVDQHVQHDRTLAVPGRRCGQLGKPGLDRSPVDRIRREIQGRGTT